MLLLAWKLVAWLRRFSGPRRPAAVEPYPAAEAPRASSYADDMV